MQFRLLSGVAISPRRMAWESQRDAFDLGDLEADATIYLLCEQQTCVNPHHMVQGAKPSTATDWNRRCLNGHAMIAAHGHWDLEDRWVCRVCAGQRQVDEPLGIATVSTFAIETTTKRNVAAAVL